MIFKVILWYSKGKDIERDVSIDTLSTVWDVSRQHCICYVSPTPVKQLVAGVWQQMSKDWSSLISRAEEFQNPKFLRFCILYLQIKVSPHSSQIQIQIHIQDPIPPEASKRRRVIRLIRHQKEILAEISILLLTIWHGMEIDFSCQMELGAKPQMTYACTLHPLPWGKKAGCCWCIRWRFQWSLVTNPTKSRSGAIVHRLLLWLNYLSISLHCRGSHLSPNLVSFFPISLISHFTFIVFHLVCIFHVHLSFPCSWVFSLPEKSTFHFAHGIRFSVVYFPQFANAFDLMEQRCSWREGWELSHMCLLKLKPSINLEIQSKQ